jgi:hypothetical protein
MLNEVKHLLLAFSNFLEQKRKGKSGFFVATLLRMTLFLGWKMPYGHSSRSTNCFKAKSLNRVLVLLVKNDIGRKNIGVKFT